MSSSKNGKLGGVVVCLSTASTEALVPKRLNFNQRNLTAFNPSMVTAVDRELRYELKRCLCAHKVGHNGLLGGRAGGRLLRKRSFPSKSS